MAYFVIPFETVTRPNGMSVRQEKYIPALGVTRQIIDFGAIAIGWADTTPEQLATVSRQADVLAVPDLDAAVDIPAVAAHLEALHVPAHWMQPGLNYRKLLQSLIGMAHVCCRMTDHHEVDWSLAGNLDRRLSDLPADVQAAFIESVMYLGQDKTQIPDNATVREALATIGHDCATTGHLPGL